MVTRLFTKTPKKPILAELYSSIEINFSVSAELNNQNHICHIFFSIPFLSLVFLRNQIFSYFQLTLQAKWSTRNLSTNVDTSVLLNFKDDAINEETVRRIWSVNRGWSVLAIDSVSGEYAEKRRFIEILNAIFCTVWNTRKPNFHSLLPQAPSDIIIEFIKNDKNKIK